MSNRDAQRMPRNPVNREATERKRTTAWLRSAWTCVFVGCFLALVSPTPVRGQSSHFTGRVIRVISAEQIVARLQTWNVTVRLHGVVAPPLPEARERAREYVARRVLGTDVSVTVRGTGPNETVYGEVLTSDNLSLNQEIARAGLAGWASTYAPNRTDIGMLVRDAQQARRGIWGDPTAANVPLPPSAAALTHPTAKPTPKPIPSRTPTPTPSPLPTPTTAPTPTPQPSALPTPTPTPVAASMPPSHEGFGFLYLGLGAVFVGAFLAILTALAVSVGITARRLPFQALTAFAASVGLTLLVPLILAVADGIRASRTLDAVALAPPLIALAAWQAIRLCQREQILRAAPERTVAEIATNAANDGPAARSLVRVRGTAAGLYRQEAFVSSVGAISGIYLRELTQIYEAVPTSESAESRRARRKQRLRRTRMGLARRATGRESGRRYAWRTVHDGTWASDFLLADLPSDSFVVVEGARADFYPLQTARFYNEVPVEQWFARPYPGDTRTEVAFIPADAPLTVWGRVRRGPTAGSGGEDESRVVFDAAHEMLVVTEGEGAAIWSNKPLFGLTLILIAIALAALLAYCVATPGALD